MPSHRIRPSGYRKKYPMKKSGRAAAAQMARREVTRPPTGSWRHDVAPLVQPGLPVLIDLRRVHRDRILGDDRVLGEHLRKLDVHVGGEHEPGRGDLLLELGTEH